MVRIESPPPLAWNLGGALTAGLQLRLAPRRPLGHPRGLAGSLSLQIGRQPFFLLVSANDGSSDQTRQEILRGVVLDIEVAVFGNGMKLCNDLRIK